MKKIQILGSFGVTITPEEFAAKFAQKYMADMPAEIVSAAIDEIADYATAWGDLTAYNAASDI